MSEHFSFSLLPKEPYALRYFVVHSGVAEAFQQIQYAYEDLKKDPSLFRLFFIYGPHGVGKTHLVQGFLNKIREEATNRIEFAAYEITSTCDDNFVSMVVSNYEAMKSSGGLMIITSLVCSDETSQNPHLRSRLLAGSVCKLEYPQEVELKPLLLSLSERRNILLNQQTLEYLLKRLPRDPLSFANIFARLDELSLSQGKAPGKKLLRSLIE